MCFGIFKPNPNPIPTPITDYVMITKQEYLYRLGLPAYNLDRPLDTLVSITSKKNLDIIISSLVYSADLYVENICDCEDYALQAQCDAAFKFHISGIRMALGNMPLGYHGFNIALDTDNNIWLHDANAGFEYAGEWFKIGENGYQPNCVFV